MQNASLPSNVITYTTAASEYVVSVESDLVAAVLAGICGGVVESEMLAVAA